MRIEYGEDSKGDPALMKVGLVDVGLVPSGKDFDLVARGPILTNAKPEDFIVQINKLSFPIDKANDIEWIGYKIGNPGPLANFILVKGADYQILKKQEEDIQSFKVGISDSIKASIKELSANMPGGTTFVNLVAADIWLKKIKIATGLCGQVVEKGLPNVLKEEIHTLGEKTHKVIKFSLSKAKSMPDITKALTEEQKKLDICLKNIAELQKKPSLENVLYKFYETYLTGTQKISDWWVITPRKIEEPEKPITPENL